VIDIQVTNSQGDTLKYQAYKKAVEGRRFTTIEMESISPRTVGNLIATWENKTILNSLLWNVNAFDQWGVELGKANTKKYLK
jgi:glucose-6-phosphate isomerase